MNQENEPPFRENLTLGSQALTAEASGLRPEVERTVNHLENSIAELRNSEDRFRSYFELGLIGMAIISVTRDILDVNNELCRILGYGREELLALGCTAITHPDDRLKDNAQFDSVIAGEIQSYSLDKRWIRKDGGIVYGTISVSCMRGEDGDVDYFIALLQDVTERRLAEFDRRKFALLAEHSTEFIGICDLDFQVTYVNPAGRRQVGIGTLRDVEKTFIWDYFFPEDHVRVRKEILPKLVKTGVNETEIRFRRFDTGDPVWMIFTAFAIRGPDDAAIAYCTISRDITDRKRSAERLRQAYARLESRADKRTRELKQLNEELRKEVAERKKVEEEREQLLRRIVRAQEDERQRIAQNLHDEMGQYLSTLTLGLDSLSCSTSGVESLVGTSITNQIRRLEKLARRVDRQVDELILKLRPPILDELGLVAALQQHVDHWSKMNRINVDYSHHGMNTCRLKPEVEITLFRVVQEALTNVAKHAAAGSVALCLQHKSNRHVTVIVEDDGVGFDAAPGGETKGCKRFGIAGMTERVAQLGGTIEIESAVGKGTSLFARVPF